MSAPAHARELSKDELRGIPKRQALLIYRSGRLAAEKRHARDLRRLQQAAEREALLAYERGYADGLAGRVAVPEPEWQSVPAAGRRSPHAEAVEWLERELLAGPVPAPTIKARAHGAGHAERTLKRAKQTLGVMSIPTGGRSRAWSLP